MTAYDRGVPDASRVQLVCFDLGGVLIRICRSWAEGCRAAGLAVRGESVEDPSSANGSRDIGRLHQTGKISCAEFFTRVADASGGMYVPDEIERIHDAWMYGEYPGVLDVIDRVHQAGRMTAALSNTNASHWRRLLAMPAVSRLTHALASHELGLVKPDEAIYREAERRFGIRSDRILFFDDLADNIAAAARIGWQAVKIDHAGDTARQIESALRERQVLLAGKT